jgi:hypothetical protein
LRIFSSIPEVYSNSLTTTSGSKTSLPFPPLGLSLLYLKLATISSWVIAAGKLHHELNYVRKLTENTNILFCALSIVIDCRVGIVR